MAERRIPQIGGPTKYEIVVRGELGERFASAFGGMTIHAEGRETHIIGEVVDQSQLHGLLDRIRALGIELISVTPLSEKPQGPASRAPPDVSSA
jgi:hypothetical protein